MFTAMYKTIYVNCQSHKYSKPGLVFSVPADAPVGNQKNSAWSAPSHYLNQCWNVVNKTPKNKLQWKSIQNTKFSFMKMHLKTSSAKRRPFCPGGDELKFEGKTKGSTGILDIRVMHFLKGIDISKPLLINYTVRHVWDIRRTLIWNSWIQWKLNSGDGGDKTNGLKFSMNIASAERTRGHTMNTI